MYPNERAKWKQKRKPRPQRIISHLRKKLADRTVVSEEVPHRNKHHKQELGSTLQP